MNWSNYLYLLPLLVLALALLAALVRRIGSLSSDSPRVTGEEVLFIALASILGIAIIYGNFLAEHSYFAYGIGDSGSDTFEQYVPFYLNHLNRVKTGTLDFWSFDYGLGVNSAGYQSWLYDPFNVIVVAACLLLGSSHLSFALVISQAAKILICAFSFDRLLTFFCRRPASRILGALVYCFSGYLILYGQHYWLGSAFAVFTVSILVFELFLDSSTPARFIAATALVAVLILWTAYVAFMVLLFVAVYLAFRIIARQKRASVGGFLRKTLLMCVPVVCGALLACVTLLPYASYLLGETSRTSGDASLTERLAEKATSFVNLDWIPAILSRFLGSGLITTGNATVVDVVSPSSDIDFTGSFAYEFILLGFSCSAFLLLSQFIDWVARDVDRKVRRLTLVATTLVALYCLHQLIPTIFTMMVKLQYRSCFVVAAPCCIAMAVGFEQRILSGKLAKGPALAALALTAITIAWSIVHTVTGRLVCLVYLAAFVALVCLVALMARGTNLWPALPALFLALTFSTSLADGFFVTNSRGYLTQEGFPRAETSQIQKDTIAALGYLEQIDDGFYRVEKTYADVVPRNDSLIERYAGASFYNSTVDSDVNEFYKMLWEEAIPTWVVWSKEYPIAPDSPEIADLLGIRYVLSIEQVDFSWLEPVMQVGQVRIYRNEGATPLTIHGTAVAESQTDRLSSSKERREVLASSVIVPDTASDLIASSETEVAYSVNLTKGSESSIVGSFSSNAEGVACLAVPHTATWEIYIDGQRVKTFRANYGFVGFRVPSGEHTIEARYYLAGLDEGIALSCVGATLTTLCAVVLWRRSAKGAVGSSTP